MLHTCIHVFVVLCFLPLTAFGGTYKASGKMRVANGKMNLELKKRIMKERC